MRQQRVGQFLFLGDLGPSIPQRRPLNQHLGFVLPRTGTILPRLDPGDRLVACRRHELLDDTIGGVDRCREELLEAVGALNRAGIRGADPQRIEGPADAVSDRCPVHSRA